MKRYSTLLINANQNHSEISPQSRVLTMQVMKSGQMQDTFQSTATEFDDGMEKENTRMTPSRLFFFFGFLKLMDELLFVCY